MADSRRRQFLEALRARLNQITVANGYNTNAGAQLFIGFTPDMGPDDPDTAIAIMIGEDDQGWQAKKMFYILPVEIHALAKADIDDPWMAVESLIQDIKRAVELEDRTFEGVLADNLERGPTRPTDREPGALFVGATVTYQARIAEAWGDP